MFKRAQVIMLPTNQKAKTGLYLRSDNTLFLETHRNIVTHHLYMLSNEEIEKDDWFIDINNMQSSGIQQCTEKHLISFLKEGIKCKKIISTTDTNLKKEIADEGWKSPDPGGWNEYKPIYGLLPQPSVAFIKKYVEEYNKGNIITDVMVEYDMMYRDMTGEHKAMMLIGTEYPKLKINPKNNTITTKKVKDNFNLEELEDILVKHYFDIGLTQGCNLGEDVRAWTKKWIADNF